MTGRNARTGGKQTTEAPRVAELEAELAATRDQRLRDQARLSQVTRERDRLKFELAERNLEEARAMRIIALRQKGLPTEEGDDVAQMDGWFLKGGAERARLRGEASAPKSILARLTASLLLRFARAAARNRHYARAEVLYQAIILLAPRGFVWRQTGNMLAGQGLYITAVDFFDQAIGYDEADHEAWHAKAVALRRASKPDESMMAMERAIALNPELAKRNVD